MNENWHVSTVLIFYFIIECTHRCASTFNLGLQMFLGNWPDFSNDFKFYFAVKNLTCFSSSKQTFCPFFKNLCYGQFLMSFLVVQYHCYYYLFIFLLIYKL
jgi:hypothetical protein